MLLKTNTPANDQFTIQRAKLKHLQLENKARHLYKVPVIGTHFTMVVLLLKKNKLPTLITERILPKHQQ